MTKVTNNTIFIADLVKLINMPDIQPPERMFFKNPDDGKITIKEVDDYADFLADYYFYKGYLAHFAHKATMEKQEIVLLSADTAEIISKFYSMKGLDKV